MTHALVSIVHHITDFEDVLRLDPNCAEAKEELASTRGVLAQRHKIRHSKGRYDGDISDEEEDRNAWMVDASARPTLQDPDMETPFESDTDDLWHEGNGVPCRYYNHDGCKLGTACRSKHAPDNRSVRDHLCVDSSPLSAGVGPDSSVWSPRSGRNVCMYYLLCICKFGADRCVYAHDKTHLEPGGWWNNPARVRGNVEGLHECEMMAGHAAMDELLGPMWNGAIRKGAYLLLPQSGDEDEEGEDEDEDDNDRLAREAFQRDLREVMAATTSGPASGASRGRGGGQKSGHGRGHGRGRRQGGKRGGGRRQKSSLGGMFEGRGDRGTLRSMSEEDERMMNCGYTFDEMNDLICQGIKPWD